MAKRFLVPINMNTLEIQNQLVHNIIKASEPAGAEGQIYADTTNNLFMYHDGTNWKTVSFIDTAPASHDFDVHTGDVDLTDLGSYVDGSVIIGGVSDWEPLVAGSPSDVLTMGTNRPEWAAAGAPGAHD
ncbi:MAG: hypothetical protein ACTSQF_01820, partial [Candidatus Heimdallarchaeaceae archaeon]